MKFKNYIFLLLFCNALCFSQVKNEKEERIKQAHFPELASSYFSFIANNASYLKFYKETDGEKVSFEAKFKLNKLHYSVEFDSIGTLEDIEILIKQKHIPKASLQKIKRHFSDKFEKIRFIKIQKQFINNSSKTDKQFIEHIVNNPNQKPTHFEIIAEIKTKERHELRELTFNENGTFKKSRKVTSASYEHALY
ncbi:hypothetical protein FUA26_08910 [Seonamhaeicola algicola]|uniref:Uncharacterized protein n=1 Tax=Seonamhaeicola algicola TaxID=1719036 RepID=A0A5C7APJ1_9FLAO|nr:hypothetical protein [Seonamhaeicola algicola]TXE09599.1 hypothetical protein FUA26_08910 [Seonamhaeicola algicola]